MFRRQIAYYASGEQEVPQYVALACIGWKSQRRLQDRQAVVG
jgi:hypothetical protein